MPGRKAAEFTWLESKGLYRKRIKNPHTGRWRDIYGHTKDEVRENVRSQLEEWAASAAELNSPKVYQYCKKWYDLNTGKLAASTRSNIINVINNHICPVIGEMPMSEVTRDDTLRVMAACSELSNGSQKMILNVMCRIFDAAELSDVVVRSPARGLKAGGRPTAEKAPLSREQQAALVDAVRDTRCWPFVMLCLYAGLRREEALGLKWDCVHLDAATPYLSVRRTATWENHRPVVSDRLKSAAARRDIPIPPQLVDCLRSLEHSVSGHVVADTKGGPMSQQSFYSIWGQIKTRTVRTASAAADGVRVERKLKLGDKVRNSNVHISLDFNVTPHQLRHTYITELILAGANIKTVQYLAGHSKVSLTLDIYTHLTERQPKFTAAAVLAAFAPDSSGKNPLGVNLGVQNDAKTRQSVESTVYS